LFILGLSFDAYAVVTYKDQLGISLGMINAGFSQNSGAFDETKGVSSGSVAVISLDFNYEFFTSRRTSYSFRATGSGIAGEVSKYYAVSGGRKYYFGADGVSAVFVDQNIKVITNPVFRYYAGWSLGFFSMVYEPKKEVRSDLGIEIGGNGGILYMANNSTSYKGELSVLRGVGVETTSFIIQIFAGATFYINSLF